MHLFSDAGQRRPGRISLQPDIWFSRSWSSLIVIVSAGSSSFFRFPQKALRYRRSSNVHLPSHQVLLKCTLCTNETIVHYLHLGLGFRSDSGVFFWFSIVTSFCSFSLVEPGWCEISGDFRSSDLIWSNIILLMACKRGEFGRNGDLVCLESEISGEQTLEHWLNLMSSQ